MNRGNWIFMRCVMSFCIAGILISSHAQEQPRGIVPVEIEELFSVLPKQDEKWKLIKSKGWQGVNGWLESSASRTFESVALDLDDKPVTRRVKLTLQDTGKFPGSDINLFDNFTPGEEEEVNRVYFNSTPVVVIERGSRLFAQFLLQGRFILSISFYDVPKSELGDWFKKMNVKLLSSVSDGPVVDLPTSYVSRSVDEMTGRNKTSVIHPRVDN